MILRSFFLYNGILLKSLLINFLLVWKLVVWIFIITAAAAVGLILSKLLLHDKWKKKLISQQNLEILCSWKIVPLKCLPPFKRLTQSRIKILMRIDLTFSAKFPFRNKKVCADGFNYIYYMHGVEWIIWQKGGAWFDYCWISYIYLSPNKLAPQQRPENISRLKRRCLEQMKSATFANFRGFTIHSLVIYLESVWVRIFSFYQITILYVSLWYGRCRLR